MSAAGPDGAVRPGRPPGPVADCVDCRHWTPGAVVYRGNTVGTCGRDGRARGADSWCPEHEMRKEERHG